jgi:hypothetical protein
VIGRDPGGRTDHFQRFGARTLRHGRLIDIAARNASPRANRDALGSLKELRGKLTDP